MKNPIMTATILALMPVSNVLAQEACLTLDVDVFTVDENWNTIERIDPTKDVLNYGDRFRLHLLGNLPGKFRMFTINPLNVINTEYEGAQTSGKGAVVLPCGPETDTKTCPENPGAPMILDNDFAQSQQRRIEEEKIVIEYFPCFTDQLNTDVRFGPEASNSVEFCAQIIDPEFDMDQAYQNLTYESLRVDSKSSSCDYNRDANGRLVLRTAIIIQAAQ